MVLSCMDTVLWKTAFAGIDEYSGLTSSTRRNFGLLYGKEGGGRWNEITGAQTPTSALIIHETDGGRPCV